MATDSASTSEMDIGIVGSMIDSKLDENEMLQDDEEAAKQAALAAIDRGEKTPNEDKILADLKVELACYKKERKNRVSGSLDPVLLANLEEYMDELKEAAAKRPPVKLEEDRFKHERSFMNIPVYNPNDPQFSHTAATFNRHIEEAEISVSKQKLK